MIPAKTMKFIAYLFLITILPLHAEVVSIGSTTTSGVEVTAKLTDQLQALEFNFKNPTKQAVVLKLTHKSARCDGATADTSYSLIPKSGKSYDITIPAGQTVTFAQTKIWLSALVHSNPNVKCTTFHSTNNVFTGSITLIP